jgi:hypothetical protein
MGNMVMGKCEHRQKKSCIIKTNCKHSKGGYGRLPLGNVDTCHGFFQRIRKFEEVDSKTFFHKLTQRFIDRGFGNQLLIKFMKPTKQLYAILGRQAWVPQEFRNKMLKHLVNCQMVRLALKP